MPIAWKASVIGARDSATREFVALRYGRCWRSSRDHELRRARPGTIATSGNCDSIIQWSTVDKRYAGMRREIITVSDTCGFCCAFQDVY